MRYRLEHITSHEFIILEYLIRLQSNFLVVESTGRGLRDPIVRPPRAISLRPRLCLEPDRLGLCLPFLPIFASSSCSDIGGRLLPYSETADNILFQEGHLAVPFLILTNLWLIRVILYMPWCILAMPIPGNTFLHIRPRSTGFSLRTCPPIGLGGRALMVVE